MSGLLEGLANGNRTPDIWFDRKIIRYSAESEIRAMSGGIILVKEPAPEWMTDENLVYMCFGC